MKLPVYLDYAATTPVDPAVANIMVQYLTQDSMFGNSSSTHFYGQAAKEAVEFAREQVANLIHAEASEIIWTSGATEANNLALKGAAQLYKKKGRHIITVKTEHLSVLDCCQQLEKDGFSVSYLSPDKNGLLDLQELKSALRDDTIMVSVMHVNNEIGVINDIAAIGDITSSRDILLHVDAAQSAGKIPIDVEHFKVDLLTLSAHKVYGPKGIGALYVRKKPRIRVAAQMHGGGQESGMRSGTLPVHQIAGMGKAFALAAEEMLNDDKRIRHYREIFLKGISSLENISLVGDSSLNVPGILNLCFKGVTSEDVIAALPDLAISSGSACSSKGNEPSYVLRALGLDAVTAKSCVRISLGRFTTLEEIEFMVDCIRKML
jgi:cysteine desulfurase